ncbi:MAG TPA: amino acid adenylation domain-containing protein [Candidatus Angelobacter sp.]
MTIIKDGISERRSKTATRKAGLSLEKQAQLKRLLKMASSAEPAAKLIRPRPQSGHAALSFAQQRLWFVEQMSPGTALYNIPVVLRLSGHLKISALQQGLTETVRRHESLRTHFVDDHGQPVQVIAPPHAVDLPLIDLSAAPELEREAQARKIAVEINQRPFDLARDLLLRATLLRLAPQEHVLVLSVHHIAADGWSLQILVREVGTIYAALCRNGNSVLPELPIQYADYAYWQRQRMQSNTLDALLSYWKAQLLESPPLLELPYDRPRPAVASFKGELCEVTVPKKLTEQLIALSHQEHVTLFMTLLASFQLLLMRYSGQDDITVGTPVAGRPSAETEELIGIFVNTVVLRTRFTSNLSFRQLLAGVRETVLEAQTHQELPFEKLVEELKPERSLSYAPLFQAMFVLQNVPQASMEVEGLQLSTVASEPGVEEFDLTFSITEEKSGLRCSLSYSTDLFDRSTIERMLGHWNYLLETIVSNPDLQVARAVMVSPEQEAHLLQASNGSAISYGPEKLVHQLFEEQVAKAPAAVALDYEDQQLTYAELNERANQLAHYLRKLKVGPETRVGICMERGFDLIVSMLAVLKTGGAYVPLDPKYPAERLDYMAQDSGMHVLLTQGALRQQLANFAGKLVELDSDRELIAQESTVSLDAGPSPANLAYVIYTSGSTGKPKGVTVEHRQIFNQLMWAGDALAFAPQDRVLQKTSYSFDASVIEIFLPLSRGTQIVIAKPGGEQDVEYLLQLAISKQVTYFDLSPSLLEALLVDPMIQQWKSLRVMCSGAEAIKPETVSTFYQLLKAQLWNAYGPTEATVQSSVEVCKPGGHNVSIGKPISNTQMYVLDGDGQLSPVGVPGELFIGGLGTARGYLDRPALTAEKFVPDHFSSVAGARLYRTGDWARWRSDGKLEFLGRKDAQVKLRGHRIELGEIETALRLHAEIKDAAVLVKKDSNSTGRLVGYVVPRTAPGLDDAALRQFLQDKLPEYMIPAVYLRLTELPQLPNGKLDLRSLPDPATELRRMVVPPRTVIEEVLAEIWGHVLSVQSVNRTDDFFALGGHSLLATRIISRLRESFKIELPVRALFESPILASLAARIEAAMRSQAARPGIPLRAIHKEGVVPSSYAQQRLWFLDQLAPNSSAYNISTIVQLDAGLNLTALQQSLSEVIRRHHALRTTFTKVNGQAMQVIGQAQPVNLLQVDLRGLSEEDQNAQTRKLAEQDAAQPFDLSAGPLFRASLFRLSQQHTMLVTMHHIVSDGWSMGIMMQEVEALYQAFSAGHASPLSELEIQYADYSEWQREQLQGEFLAGELSYWKQQLAGAPTVLELETDHPRPAIRTQGGVQCQIELPVALSRAVHEFGRAQGATTFMTLMAAFQALLGRYTGQDDILVGSPVAGRSRVELEGLIGFFVNMVVMRADLRARPTFRELLRQVRESALGAYAHQDLPFEKLVEELQPERSIGRNPLFQVILAFQNAPMPASELAGVTLPSGSTGSSEMKFDLELYFWEDQEGIAGSLVYSPELFESSTIQRFIQHFLALLHKVVADPDVRLVDVGLLTKPEFHQVVEEWNQTDAAFPVSVCVHQLIEARAAQTPDATAIICEHEQMSYRELNLRANLVANYLRHLGVGAESLVAICMEKSLELVIGLLGILKAGGAYVPLDPEYPLDRLAYIFEDSKASVLLTQQSCLQKLPQQQAKVVCLDSDWPTIAQEYSIAPVCGAGSGNLAYVIYTSGSTGQPKGAMVRHSSLVNLVTWHNRAYGVSATDRAIQLAGIAFDAATWEIWPYLVAGASLFLPRAKSQEIPFELKNWLKSREISICFLSTPLAEAVIDHLPSGLALKYMLTGGDRLHKVKKELEFQLINHYGPTEITVLCTCAPVDFKSPSPPIGRPIANSRIYILDKHLQPVPLGATGEIYVGGEGVGRGYWRRPELTAEFFVPDPFSGTAAARLYRTGDLGKYLPDGTIEYRGRIDHQVKIRGFRIELGEIESALKQQPDVREALVLARQDGPGEKRLVAYVVARAESVTADKLKTELKNRLPEYMVPGLYVFLKELPMTQHGKVDTAGLPAPDFSRSEKTYAAPKDPLQQQLVNIWEELLPARPIGVTDDFFELGGHSLLAVQLITRIEEKLKKRIPMASLFQSATIEHLAHALGQETDTQSWSPLVPIRTEGSKKPMYVVHGAGGHLLAYSDLARNWATDQPLYGLQSRETNKELQVHTQVEAMAAEYVASIRAFQPEGPYMVAGWSMGGVIAFEMARQLQQQGQKLALVALVDPEAPSEKPAEYNWAVLLGSFVTDLGMPMETIRAAWDEIFPLPPMQQLNRVWSLSKKINLVPADMTLVAFRKLFDSFKTSAQTMRSYAGGIFEGRIDLFVAENPIEYIGREAPKDYYTEETGSKGWERLAAQGVQVHISPGQHYTMMQEPHVKTLAEKLHACIESATKDIQ